jgi:hypothetical protein
MQHKSVGLFAKLGLINKNTSFDNVMMQHKFIGLFAKLGFIIREG